MSGYILTKFYLHSDVLDWIWPVDRNMLTPVLNHTFFFLTSLKKNSSEMIGYLNEEWKKVLWKHGVGGWYISISLYRKICYIHIGDPCASFNNNKIICLGLCSVINLSHGHNKVLWMMW